MTTASSSSPAPHRADAPAIGDFPYPVTDGPTESPCLTWLRNNSNYMAPRGLLDYLRALAALARGLAVNFLIFLPWLLVAAVGLGVAHHWMLSHPYHLTSYALVGAVIWILGFTVLVPVLRIFRYKRSLETGSESTIKERDAFERCTGAILLGILALAVIESLPFLLELLHARLRDGRLNWPESFATIAASVALLSGADKLLSALGGFKKKLAMALIGIVGLVPPLVVIFYATDFLLYGPPLPESYVVLPLILPLALVLASELALVYAVLSWFFVRRVFRWREIAIVQLRLLGFMVGLGVVVVAVIAVFARQDEVLVDARRSVEQLESLTAQVDDILRSGAHDTIAPPAMSALNASVEAYRALRKRNDARHPGLRPDVADEGVIETILLRLKNALLPALFSLDDIMTGLGDATPADDETVDGDQVEPTPPPITWDDVQNARRYLTRARPLIDASRALSAHSEPLRPLATALARRAPHEVLKHVRNGLALSVGPSPAEAAVVGQLRQELVASHLEELVWQLDPLPPDPGVGSTTMVDSENAVRLVRERVAQFLARDAMATLPEWASEDLSQRLHGVPVQNLSTLLTTSQLEAWLRTAHDKGTDDTVRRAAPAGAGIEQRVDLVRRLAESDAPMLLEHVREQLDVGLLAPPLMARFALDRAVLAGPPAPADQQYLDATTLVQWLAALTRQTAAEESPAVVPGGSAASGPTGLEIADAARTWLARGLLAEASGSLAEVDDYIDSVVGGDGADITDCPGADWPDARFTEIARDLACDEQGLRALALARAEVMLDLAWWFPSDLAPPGATDGDQWRVRRLDEPFGVALESLGRWAVYELVMRLMTHQLYPPPEAYLPEAVSARRAGLVTVLGFGPAGLLDPAELRTVANVFGPKAAFLVLLAVAIFFVVWFTVDVNLTSIHALYRDRLASAFLVGRDRRGDVDIEEDIDLEEICGYEVGSTAPYHLINTALNLQGSKDKRVRDRKSDFFVFSKRFIGSERTGFCRSEVMESVFPQMDLATAMAISAAAASPNMGRVTSPLLVAFMTLLNIRLGYWVPNPGYLEERLSGKSRRQMRARRRSGYAALGFSFAEVFQQELAEIASRWENVYGSSEARRAGQDEHGRQPTSSPTTAHRLAAIAFSGGGIRSAALNLGIAQALHARGTFTHLDYMSTVSGGGYLGSSISTMMRRGDLHATVGARRKTLLEVRLNRRRSSTGGRVSAVATDGDTGAKVITIEARHRGGAGGALLARLAALVPTWLSRRASGGSPGDEPPRTSAHQFSRFDRVVVRAGQRVAPGQDLIARVDTITERFRWRVRPSAFLREMLSRLDETHRWVNLSDGGHIENLGVIELLRRRCKYIIVGDGEADPKVHFGGLATLIRTAYLDLGVEIEIDLSPIRLTRSPADDDPHPLSQSHWAIGKIIYPRTDEGEGREEGYLLYLKSSVTGEEGEAITEYRHRNPAFPHQTTADQFFDEGQFEAYRALGQRIAETALAHRPTGDEERRHGPDGTPSSDERMSFEQLEAWFEKLWEMRREPPAPKAETHGDRLPRDVEPRDGADAGD